MARMTSSTGATVTVDDAKVDGLLDRGFTVADEPKKAPAKKTAAAKKSAENE